MKKLLLILPLILIVAGVATIPLWGNCDQKYSYCAALCSIKNYDSDAKEAGCKARCSGEKGSCMADAGVDSIGEFIEGLNGN